MLKISLISLLLCLVPAALSAPQDMATKALLAAAQVKDVLETGAAARDTKSFEFGGAKMSNTFEVGAGDAIRQRNRRAMPVYIPEDSDYSDSSEERLKRDVSLSESSEEKGQRQKRDLEHVFLKGVGTDDSDDSSSDEARRKRDVNLSESSEEQDHRHKREANLSESSEEKDHRHKRDVNLSESSKEQDHRHKREVNLTESSEEKGQRHKRDLEKVPLLKVAADHDCSSEEERQKRSADSDSAY